MIEVSMMEPHLNMLRLRIECVSTLPADLRLAGDGGQPMLALGYLLCPKMISCNQNWNKVPT